MGDNYPPGFRWGVELTYQEWCENNVDQLVEEFFESEGPGTLNEAYKVKYKYAMDHMKEFEEYCQEQFENLPQGPEEN